MYSYNKLVRRSMLQKEEEMFSLTTHSTHFIYGYMASDIWLRTYMVSDIWLRTYMVKDLYGVRYMVKALFGTEVRKTL